MLRDNLSQRNAGFSKELEILRAQSLSHPDKAEISANASDEFKVNPKMANYLSRGGGMTWEKGREVSENA